MGNTGFPGDPEDHTLPIAFALHDSFPSESLQVAGSTGLRQPDAGGELGYAQFPGAELSEDGEPGSVT
jgi:hypothetical protein